MVGTGTLASGLSTGRRFRGNVSVPFPRRSDTYGRRATLVLQPPRRLSEPVEDLPPTTCEIRRLEIVVVVDHGQDEPLRHCVQALDAVALEGNPDGRDTSFNSTDGRHRPTGRSGSVVSTPARTSSVSFANWSLVSRKGLRLCHTLILPDECDVFGLGDVAHHSSGGRNRK